MTKCVGEVEFPDLRHELIMRFLYLSDADYQQREWIENWKDKARYPERSFGDDLEMYHDFMDSQRVFHYVEEKKVPYDHIGYWLKTEREAEALYKVAEYLEPLPMECFTNAEYLSSPHLPKLREAAKEAFDIFMANEKDDKEFCKLVERVKQENAGVKQPETKSQSGDWPLPLDKGYCDVSGEPPASLSLEDVIALDRAFKKWDIDIIISMLAKGGWKLDRRVFEKLPPKMRYAAVTFYGVPTIKLAKDGACAVKAETRSRAMIKFSSGTSYLSVVQGDSSASDALNKEDHVQIVTGGKLLARDGTTRKEKPDGTQPPHPDTCIPVKEWLEWTQWNRKL